MKQLLPLLALLLVITKSFSQQSPEINRWQGGPDTTTVPGASILHAAVIKGVVKSAIDTTTLQGITVSIQKVSDPEVVKVAVTDAKGRFRFGRVAVGYYIVKLEALGFIPLTKHVLIQQTVDLGVFSLQETSTTIDEVVIVGNTPLGAQQGDTTQFNATAFKAAPDATAHDLVQKMPGITFENGKVQAQGEVVQQLLIDGKPFFVNDVYAALQNLPAQLILYVQIFDKKNDRAELSGVDDGARMRTINIVTKPAAREGFFGTVATGYGTDNTYLLGTSLNLFKNERRLTLTGLNNNINTHSLSANPSYSGASNTFDGVTKPSSVGLDYSNTWSDIVAVSSSYYFNHTNNKFSQARTGEYAQYASDERVFSNNRQNNGISGNHVFNTRLDYEINERNSIRIRTRGYLLQYNGSSHWLSRTGNEEDPIVQLEAGSRTDSTYFYLDNDIIYRHRFRKAGRTINIGLGNSYNANKDDRAHFSKDIYYPEDNNRTNRQYHKSKGKDVSWETNFAYTEPFGVYGQIELGHRIGNRRHDLDRKFYGSGDGVLEEDTQFQEDFSNASKSSYLTQKTSVGYSYNNDVLYFQVGGAFQQARLKDDQQFPFTSTLDRSFTSYLPSARLRYKFSESNNLELHYDTWTNAPSASQLQEEIHWQNPLLLKIGNPGLQQAFYNWFRARYRAHNLEKDHHFYTSIEATSASQEIVYGIMTDGYMEEISNGIILLPDAQLVRPENLQGGRNFRTYVSYGQPLGFIRANLNLHGSISHSRRPGIINGYMNFFNTNTYGMGALISSNISERIDFNLSTHSSYRVFRNTMLPMANKNFLSQRTRIWYNWIFGENFVYRTSINHQFTSGHVESYSGHTFHWNMSLGKKLFPNRLGELSVRAYDLLKQQNSVSRNITALYIEDVESNVLERYFMLAFTYNIRYFGGGDTGGTGQLY